MRKHVQAFVTNPLLLTASLFIMQLGLFLWITLRPFSLAPPGRTYYIMPGQDAYVSYIRQAKDGAWKLYNPYTTRPSPAVYIHIFYVLMGKIAGIFSLDPVTLYMVLRVIAGLILFIATYWVIITILPTGLQSLAVLFTLGLETGPLVSAIHNLRSFLIAPPAIFSYFPQDVAERHFGLPHHVLAEALGLFLLGNVFLFVKKQTRWRLVLIGVLTVSGGLIMPAYNGMLVLTVCIAWFVWSVAKKQTKKIIPALIVIVLCLGAAGLFTKLQMDSSFAFKYFNIDEKGWTTDPFLLVNYLSSLILYIPAAVFFLVTIPRVWRRLSADIQLQTVLAVSWVVGPLLYIPFTHLSIFPFANFRLIDGYAYVPMGILASLGIREITRRFNKRIAAIAVGLLILISLVLTIDFTHQRFEEQQDLWRNVYPLNQEWDAIRFLSTVPRQSGVLVTKFFGEIIPSYATVHVFLGETPGQIDWTERYLEATRFYSGQMTDADALKFLSKEHISYIYWGYDEKSFLKTTALYPNILTPVFRQPAVTIFVQIQ